LLQRGPLDCHNPLACLDHPPPLPLRLPYTTIFRSPSALACQISMTASLTGLPSPSATRPESVIRSPLTLGGASSTTVKDSKPIRSEEHTSELQSREHLVCRLLLVQQKDGHVGGLGV